MTNLAKTVNKYIKDNFSDVTIYNDLFPSDEVEGVIAIHDPATLKALDFIDGSSEKQINISYTARYSDAKKSRDILTKILDLLDGAKFTDSDDGLKVKTSAVANVQFIGADSKNNSIYTSSIHAVYTKLN